MTKRTILLSSKATRQRAHALIDAAPEGYAVTIGEETRSQEQNRLMWPLIDDMRQQIADMGRFTPEQVKLRFLNALDNEMQFLPELEGAGQFVVGQRSSTLSKTHFSGLIELMFAHGARNNVRWSAKSLDTITAHTPDQSRNGRDGEAGSTAQPRGPDNVQRSL